MPGSMFPDFQTLRWLVAMGLNHPMGVVTRATTKVRLAGRCSSCGLSNVFKRPKYEIFIVIRLTRLDPCQLHDHVKLENTTSSSPISTTSSTHPPVNYPWLDLAARELLAARPDIEDLCFEWLHPKLRHWRSSRVVFTDETVVETLLNKVRLNS
ncbi:hypothetical protein WN48_08360 [Eufriesea mexicana]|uniref:Uncharacterized protein n=1 Tax=Eufriesea mexicana TaxID=516756 RepID=A0A310SKR0_9HYME|nr:hypothetical protein WN48_08360 [Eufriesea mexicana]